MEATPHSHGRTHWSWQSRPAVFCTLLLAIGIAISDSVPCKPWIWLGLAAALLIGAALFRRQLIRAAFLSPAIFAIGLSAAQIEHFQFPSGVISDFTNDGERFAQLEVAIDQPPRLLTPSPNELRSLPPKQTAIGKVLRINTTRGWRPAAGKIMLLIEQPNPLLGPGQTIRVTGMLDRPAPPMNRGEFNFAAWSRDERILASFRVSHADGVEILTDHGPGPLVWLREKVRHLLAMGFDADRSFDHALLRAFVLGDSDPQLRDLDQKFVHTGTVHLITISGLHVVIIAGFMLLICRLLRCSPRTSLLVATAIMLLYASAALPTWPGWRSIILCLTVTGAVLGHRFYHSLQMFAVAVAVVLMIHPADLHSGGFQVSLAAVLGIVLLNPRARGYFWDWWRGPDPTSPMPRPRGVLATILAALSRFVVATIIAGGIAWGISVPLIAYHFGQLNAWAVPAGIFLLPLTVVALVAGVGKILMSLLWPGGSHGWAVAGAAPITWMRHAIDGLDRLPGASITLSPPSIGLLIAYYGLLALLLIPVRRPIMRWLMRIATMGACLILLFLPTIARGISTPASTSVAKEPLRITLISLGAGQCAIVRPTSSHADLIDVGSSTVSDLTRSLLLPCLRAENCSNVDRILLSHGDFDHISAAAEIFDKFAEPGVYTSPHFARHAVGNIPAEALLETLRLADRPPLIIHQGDHLDLGNGAAIDVLWPPLHCDMNSNNCGLVLKLSYAGRTVLFPADIQEPPERELLKHPQLLRADVLVAPHHGSAESTTADFIRAVNPKFILASNATKLTHKQRMFDVIAENYPLYRTSRCGEIDVTIEPSGEIEIQTFLGVGPQEGAMRSDPSGARR